MWRLRFALSVLLALLPSWLKVPLYRMLFGYRIGRGVRIGLSPLFGVGRCRIGDHARIGSFNLFYQVGDLEIGDHAQIGFLNLFRGGRKVRIGAYASILRQNVFNSIIKRDFVDPVDPVLDLGAGATITSGHWLDFSAGIGIGDHTIVGGRNSSFWTHNRQRGRPIAVGCHCYLGSEIRVARRGGAPVLHRGPGLGARGPVLAAALAHRWQPGVGGPGAPGARPDPDRPQDARRYSG